MNNRSFNLIQCPKCGCLNTVMRPKREKDSAKRFVCKRCQSPLTARFSHKDKAFTLIKVTFPIKEIRYKATL